MQHRHVEKKPVRSRHGCLTCRKRHRKCGEEKPVCAMCRKSGRQCEYYSNLRWATVSYPAIGNRNQGKNRKTPDNPRHRNTQQIETSISASIDLIGADANPALSSTPERVAITPQCHPPPDLWLSSAMEFPPWNSAILDPDFDLLIGEPPELSESHELMSELLDVSLDNSQQEGRMVQETGTIGNSEAALTAISPDILNLDQSLNCLVPTDFNASNDIAYTHYMRFTAGRIPAYDGPQNPYRHICAVAVSYPLLLHTILYISTLSMPRCDSSHRELVATRKSQALAYLQDAMSFLEHDNLRHGDGHAHKSSINTQALSLLSVREVALAAFLMHIVSEVMTGSHSAEAHLKDAYNLLVELEYVESKPKSFFARFLTQRFAIIDVVHSFLRRRKPIAPSTFVLYQQHEEVDNTDPSFREMTGCPQMVLTFLSKISYFAHQMTMVHTDKSSLLSEAYQLETQMRIWGENCSVSTIRNQDRDVRPEASSDENRKHLDILSECYYWTAHLLLARRVFLDPTTSYRVQLIRRHLFRIMDCLPIGCGPDSSLPFPFYMVAREAMTLKTRDWVRRKHAQMMEIYGDKSREVMMNMTEEIWAKNDGGVALPVQGADGGLEAMEHEVYIRVLDTRASHFIL